MTTRDRAIMVPANECYIAIAPRPPGRITRTVAAYAVEGQLPRPLEGLCLAWRVAGDRLVVVAVDRERADAWLADGVLSARVPSLPDALPDALGVEAKPIELLEHAFLPAKIRRHRNYRLAAVAVLLAIGCLIGAMGLQDRARALTIQAREADAAMDELARQALPKWREGLAPQLALTGELRRLRGLANTGRGDEPADSRDALAALFRAWPQSEAWRVESVESAGGRVTLRAMVPSREAAIALAGTLAEHGAFDAGLPRVRSEAQRDGEITRVELTLTRTVGGP